MEQALPVSHVRHLEIETRDEKMEFWGPDSQYVLPPLLRDCLQNLISLSYDGPLHPNLFVPILQVEHLRSLELRVGAEQISFPNLESLREPFEVNALNFSLLTTLTRPRSLQIRHLFPKEAERLAQSVAILELTRLEISCHG